MGIKVSRGPGYLGNKNLKPAGVKIEFTQEQVEEYIKCAKDPIYFAKKYIKVVTLDKGVTPFDLYDYQEALVRTLSSNRFVIGKLARQSGKALSLDTKIPTKTGWTTMGEIKVGDEIFSSNGNITKVIFKSDIFENHDCYKINFDNGEVVTADANHLWKIKNSHNNEFTWNTEQIFEKYRSLKKNKRGKGYSSGYYIDIQEAIDLPEVNLSIDPYILGLWLGDGYSAGGRIISHKTDYEEYLKNQNFTVKHSRVENNCVVANIENLHTRLNKLNLLNNKHIPLSYLRSSKIQRLNLLKGLMDTDGSVKRNTRSFEFYQKDSILIENVIELLSSLGIKCRKRFKIIDGRKYVTVSFTTDEMVFALPRKIAAVGTNKPLKKANSRIHIHSIEKVDSVQTACIQVSDESHMFLFGNWMIPTHNTTTVGCCYLLHKILFNQNMSVAILANKLTTARDILSRIRESYEHLPWWLQQGILEWTKGSIHLENGSKITAAATSSSAIRGGSYNCIFLDEFAFVPTTVAEEFFSSVYPTITAGQSTQMIIISTPKGLNMYYQLWKAAMSKQSEYVPFEVNWRQVPQYPGGPLRDDAWKEQQIKNTSERQFDAEFNCSFIGSANTLIDAQKLNQLNYGKPKQRNAEGLLIYNDPIKGEDSKGTEDRIYFITVDVARGQGGDNSAFCVFDISEMPYRTVARFKSNTVSPLLLPSYIRAVGKKYNNAHVLVEVNDIGSQVADILHYDLEYENLVKAAFKGTKGQTITDSGFGVKRVQLGVRTTIPVKKLGCAVLKNLIEQDKLLVEDPDTIDELTTFIADGQSFAADEGHTDDLVMCLVLFSWATRQDFFEALTNKDVRVEMYEKDIEKIESDIIPMIIDDGLNQESEWDGDDRWYIKNAKDNSQYWLF